MSDANKTTTDELKELVSEKFEAIVNWLKPTVGENLFLQILKFILKIPVILLLIAASPIVIIVFIIVFLIAL